MQKNKSIDCRIFQITLVEATALDDVRKLFKMEVYAKVSFSVKSKTEKRTKADKHGETNPAWNSSMKYIIAEPGIQNCGLMLVIKLYCKRALRDRYIGQAHASVKGLFDYAYPQGGSTALTLPVKKGSAETNGKVTFSYRFGERMQVEKPSWWKKALQYGPSIFLQVAIATAIGVDVEIEVPMLAETNRIVDVDDC